MENLCGRRQGTRAGEERGRGPALPVKAVRLKGEGNRPDAVHLSFGPRAGIPFFRLCNPFVVRNRVAWAVSEQPDARGAATSTRRRQPRHVDVNLGTPSLALQLMAPMIVNYSDTHKALADIRAAAEASEPGISKHVLAEAVSAVHHLCDQYDLNFEELLAEAGELYQYQRLRDLKDLESQA